MIKYDLIFILCSQYLFALYTVLYALNIELYMYIRIVLDNY